MSALGDSFRAARESQGLTLSDVAERIHIRSVYLAAIEAEDWAAIGPPVYIRGFIRTYARSLGLDPDAAVARFSDKAVGGELAALPARSPARGDRGSAVGPRGDRTVSGSRRKGGLSIGALAGVCVALALVVFVGYQFVDYQRGQSVAVKGRSAPAAQAPAQPPRAGRELHHPAAGPDAVLRPAARSEERSGVVLRLRDSSWLRVIVDGKVAMEGLYPSGTERTFSGRSATVRVGNAGGVEISVDGKDLGPMGGLGDVAERSFQL